jgi:DNA-binding winged helix-turn-helix (wHTH) protein
MSSELSKRVVNAGNLRVDPALRLVQVNEKPVNLTRTEFALLMYLIDNEDKVVSAGELLKELWASDWLADTSNLQVHISRLRSKLQESARDQRHILTVHGVGYRFASDRDPSSVPARSGLAQGALEPDVDKGQRRVQLMYDEELFLRDIQPREEFLGWEADDLLNTQFLATGGDPNQALSAAVHMISTGVLHFSTQLPVRLSNGRTRTVPVQTTLFTDALGRFTGSRVEFDLSEEGGHAR